MRIPPAQRLPCPSLPSSILLQLLSARERRGKATGCYKAQSEGAGCASPPASPCEEGGISAFSVHFLVRWSNYFRIPESCSCESPAHSHARLTFSTVRKAALENADSEDCHYQFSIYLGDRVEYLLASLSICRVERVYPQPRQKPTMENVPRDCWLWEVNKYLFILCVVVIKSFSYRVYYSVLKG